MSEERAPYGAETTEAAETVTDTPEAAAVEVPEATFDDLIAAYQQEEGEFEYIAGEGEKARKFVARRLTNLSEKIAITEAAESLLKLTKSKAVPATWKPYLRKPLNRKVATLILFAERLLIRPKLTQIQLLQLAATGGDALMEIAGPLLGAAESDASEGENEEIEQAKNA